MAQFFAKRRATHSYNDFKKQIDKCHIHNRAVQFVCLEHRCQDRILLCPLCMPQHKDHSWQTIDDFMTQDNFQTLMNGTSKKLKHFNQIQEIVETKLREIEDNFRKNIQKIRKGTEDSMNRLKSVGASISVGRETIDHEKMAEIKRYLDAQWTYERCERMKLCFDKVLNAIEEGIANISEDLQLFVQEEDWQMIYEPEYERIEQRYFTHLHPHHEKIVDFFRFNPEEKANSIRVKDIKRLEIEYYRDNPSFPAIICDNFMTPDRNRFIIEVEQSASKLLFFNATTIFVGVCRPELVRKANFREINEGGRGTYMIGSNGWTYHHTNPVLDRQDLVGFNFGNKDKILVELDFEGRGTVRFRKLGKLYDNKFEMNLDLEPKQVKNLKPIVAFSDEIGCTLRIVNVL